VLLCHSLGFECWDGIVSRDKFRLDEVIGLRYSLRAEGNEGDSLNLNKARD